MLFQPPQSESARAIFSEEQQLQAMLDFEAALVRVETRIGIVPMEKAEAIARFCSWRLFDRPALSKASALSGNIAIPMIKQLCRLVKGGAPGSESYVHWGATSQDVIDTGLVLQLRDMLRITEDAIRNICASLASLCREYATTLMAGRTWLQHAVPITFGMKAAGALDAMLRHADRLVELKGRILVLQFGGAAGTLASLGQHGEEVARALAEELGLGLPAVSWHSHRDRVVEAASFYGLMMVTIGKIARDLSLLMQTEVAEVSEPQDDDKGGSSTMPQKRNPVAVASILAGAVRVPGLLSTMLTAAMSQEHERGVGGWQAEWSTLPDLCMTTQSALETLNDVLKGLDVHPRAMQTNLDRSGGLIFAEAVSMALAERIGKHEAHTLIQAITRTATAGYTDFKTALVNNPLVRKHLSEDEVDELFNPKRYLGSADSMIRTVLNAYETRVDLCPRDGR